MQKEFKVLVLLPLRQETYDNHRHQPPLDTALKDLVFRIEPPPFQYVLTTRIQLALKEIEKTEHQKTKRYNLPNGFHVVYPTSEQAFYLVSILRSVFEHDKFLRRMIVGLSGGNVRRAMEIFLEFCTSGHITEDHILKIRHNEGDYALPNYLVARVLLRVNRRFYDGDLSYVKNILSLDKHDITPSYFVRLSILRWLNNRFHTKGPSGVNGYHQVLDMKRALTPYGFSTNSLNKEIGFLVKSRCILAEHFRLVDIEDEDLVTIGPAGVVHLDMIKSLDYLAAISEDTWYKNKDLAESIAKRISDINTQYHPNVIVQNARDLLEYLQREIKSEFPAADKYLEKSDWGDIIDLSIAMEAEKKGEEWRDEADPWFDLERKISIGDILSGTIVNRVDFGVFVEIKNGVTGLIHKSNLPEDFLHNYDFLPGEYIEVEVVSIDQQKQRMSLLFKKEIEIEQMTFGEQPDLF